MTSLLTLVYSKFLLSCSQGSGADIIIINGNIHTMNENEDSAQALAIKNGKIIAIGQNQEILALNTDQTRVYDVTGKLVLPGFIDAHIHPPGKRRSRFFECGLTGLKSERSILDSLKKYANMHPENKWIRGENLWLAAFTNGNPLKTALDSIIPDRPVYIS